MKRCPFCAEEIQEAAIKCRYCASMLAISAPSGPLQADPQTETEVLDPLEGEVRALLAVGRELAAIKLVQKRTGNNLRDTYDFVETLKGTASPQVVCPHCTVRGRVTTKTIKVKQGISGGKATAALLTGGLSLMATGLARKKAVLEATCTNCGVKWRID